MYCNDTDVKTEDNLKTQLCSSSKVPEQLLVSKCVRFCQAVKCLVLGFLHLLKWNLFTGGLAACKPNKQGSCYRCLWSSFVHSGHRNIASVRREAVINAVILKRTTAWVFLCGEASEQAGGKHHCFKWRLILSLGSLQELPLGKTAFLHGASSALSLRFLLAALC